MDSKLFPVLVTICIVTHIVRTVYEILKHKKLLKPSRLSFAVIFFNMALLWTSWFLLCKTDTFTIDLPPIIRYSGILLALIGVIIFITALFTIKTLETYEGNLITSGIYSRIRHPMYLGFILWLIGFPVFYGALYSFLLSILFTINILFWRYLEELELEKRFIGYKDYRSKTLF